MIDGMSEICIDCIHQEVCRYECHSPSEHCNDYAVADDFIPQGEWIEGENGCIKCNKCGCEIRYSYLIGNEPELPKFCCDCGAKMKGGAE